jgi:hypothetical protein
MLKATRGSPSSPTSTPAGPGDPPDLMQKLRLFSTMKADAKAFHADRAKQERLRELYGGLNPGM